MPFNKKQLFVPSHSVELSTENLEFKKLHFIHPLFNVLYMQSVQLLNDGQMSECCTEMLFNDGEMSVGSYTHLPSLTSLSLSLMSI